MAAMELAMGAGGESPNTALPAPATADPLAALGAALVALALLAAHRAWRDAPTVR